ncbi:MAG: response regulator transcription factor [Candidatus Omnitrophota bacterium]|nr:response regulator transcription factor [Candidatus Omnitrophota bacterium]
MDDKLIIIVDDDLDIAKSIGPSLKSEGFRVRGFSCAEDLFGFLDNEKPDLILLDVMLPGINGFEICKSLKNKEKFSSIPIIMLSGRDGESDRVFGLDAGSDDYIAKPFSINEIKARIRAVLRRHGAEGGEKKIYIGDMVVMDLQRHGVTVQDEKVKLTPVEFKILECLSSKKGHVFTRKRILEFLWGEEKIVIDRTIDVHIRHLRKKLGKAEKFIKNVRGIGYKLEEDSE